MGRTADLSRALLHVRPGTVGVWLRWYQGRMKVRHHLIFLVGCKKQGLLSICRYIYISYVFSLHTQVYIYVMYLYIKIELPRYFMGDMMIIKYHYKGLYEPGSIKKKTCCLNVRRLSCSLFAWDSAVDRHHQPVPRHSWHHILCIEGP